MDNIQISKEELKKVTNLHKFSSSYFWLKSREWSNFNINDILVKMTIRLWSDDIDKRQYEPEVVSEKSKTPRKYKVVHIDEYGVPFLKCIKTNGKLGNELICVAELDPSYSFFKVDPDFVEHTILAEEGQEFNANDRLKEVKRQRRTIQKQNQKMRVKVSSIEEADEFLKQLKVNDKLWVGNKGFDDEAHKRELVVKSVTYVKISALGKMGIWLSKEAEHELLNSQIVAFNVIECTGGTTNSNWYSKHLSPFDILNSYIYLKQPLSYDSKIQ